MSVELLFGIALGYVPCASGVLLYNSIRLTSFFKKDVDNFGG